MLHTDGRGATDRPVVAGPRLHPVGRGVGAVRPPAGRRSPGRWRWTPPATDGRRGASPTCWRRSRSASAERRPAPFGLLGYSMGGRFALHVALAHPDRGRAPGPGQRHRRASTTTAERAARRAADEALAAPGRARRRGGLRDVVAGAAAVRHPARPRRRPLDARLGGTAAGLASSLRLAGTGTQEPLWDRLRELDMPVLVVAGSRRRAYAARGRAAGGEHRRQRRLAVIAGAGHACHLERPDLVLGLGSAPFLAGVGPDESSRPPALERDSERQQGARTPAAGVRSRPARR